MRNSSTSSSRPLRPGLFLLCGALLLVLTSMLQGFLLDSIYNSNRACLGSAKTILFLGDSHCVSTFDPATDDRWTNVALNSEDTVQSAFKLKEILRHNPQITTIVYTLSPHNLADIRDTNLVGDSSAAIFDRYFRLLDREGRWYYATRNPTQAFRSYLVHCLAIPMEWDRHTLLLLVSPWRRLPYIGTFIPRHNQGESTYASCLAAINRHYYNEDTEAGISRYRLEGFHRLIMETESFNIRLIVVSTPVRSPYYDRIPQRFLRDYNDAIQQVRSAFPKVEFLDWQSALDLTDELFDDADHLNQEGANIVSRHIASVLDQSVLDGEQNHDDRILSR